MKTNKQQPSVDLLDQPTKPPFQNFKLLKYIRGEIDPTSKEEWANEKYHVPRDRVDAFLSIPMNLERFMSFGSLLTLDHFLHIYTLLPLRVLLMMINLIRGLFSPSLGKFYFIKAHQVCDLLKFFLIIFCSWSFCHVDTSIIYHKIRSQSFIKLYIFFNLLEVSDRLLSAVGQDSLDAMSFTVVKAKWSVEHVVRLFAQLFIALICMIIHSFLILLQASILNVALNSHNKSILTILLSNNFVEVKGCVFKRFDKNNLFQMACADVRERFHLFAMLLIVVFRNLSATEWYLDDIGNLLFDVVLVLASEVFVDWIKHAFITKFNDIPPDVYTEFSVSLSYDLLKVHEKKVFTDYFDQASRRMGLTPIPLSCIINSIVARTLGGLWLTCFLVFSLPLLFVVKMTLNLILLQWSYNHVQQYENSQKSPNGTGSAGGSTIVEGVGVTGVKEPPADNRVLHLLADLAWLEEVKLENIRRTRSDSALCDNPFETITSGNTSTAVGVSTTTTIGTTSNVVVNGSGINTMLVGNVTYEHLARGDDVNVNSKTMMSSRKESLNNIEMVNAIGDLLLNLNYDEESSSIYGADEDGKRRIERSKSVDVLLGSRSNGQNGENQSIDESIGVEYKDDVNTTTTASTAAADSWAADDTGITFLTENSIDLNPASTSRTRNTSTAEENVVTTAIVTPSEGGESVTTLKQPLSDVDRYSMISSQIV